MYYKRDGIVISRKRKFLIMNKKEYYIDVQDSDLMSDRVFTDMGGKTTK